MLRSKELILRTEEVMHHLSVLTLSVRPCEAILFCTMARCKTILSQSLAGITNI
jgi:hypothetical protein